MADIIELKSARYKSVDFVFIDATTSGGNRLIKFNFPGSDRQAIERQGKAPRAHAMVIWIPHENYYSERDNLLRVLEDGLPDTLTHPTFGDIANVINGPYELIERSSELGRASITVTFEVNDSPGIPQQSGSLPAQVQTQGDAFNLQLSADLASGYGVTNSLSGNFTDALESVQQAVDSLSTAGQTTEGIANRVAAYRASIVRVSASIGDLVQSPDQLAIELDGLFADLSNLFETPGAAFIALQSLFGFGAGDAPIVPNTVAKAERKQNRDLIQATIRVKSLSHAYLSATEAEYSTTEDLDLAQDTLEDQYVDAIENQLLSNESLEELDRLRVRAQKTLDVVRVNTRTIITVETRLIPLSVLVYSYYGSTELTEIIADLNNIKQNAFVEGELRILTA